MSGADDDAQVTTSSMLTKVDTSLDPTIQLTDIWTSSLPPEVGGN